jgi:acyl-CoA synthetase (AMP-forming)/AMP-acid ligase II
MIFLFIVMREIIHTEILLHTLKLYRDYIKENNFNSPYTALMGNNSADMIFIILALWSLKITPILINTRLTKSETKKLLQKAGCRQIIIDRKLLFTDNEFKVISYPVIPEISGIINEIKIDR